ncbi:protein FAR1-related sequence 5 [Tanacetum coccineum]
MAFNLQIQSSQPLDEAWGIVGLPNGIRVLVEEGGNFYPWGGLGCRVIEGKKSRDFVLGCEAMMQVTLSDHGEWVVDKFISEHNHPRVL